MARTPSLRSSIVAGLCVLQLVVLSGISYSVWTRAEKLEREALQRDAEVRARTLAGILERDRNGHEFDLDPSAVREYSTEGTPVFVAIADSTGKVVVRSPSLGDRDLVPAGPWVEDAMVHEDLNPGPFSVPCAAVTYSFLVRVDKGGTPPKPGREPWVPPTADERRYQIRVAVDARPRDAALASLAWFLVVVDGAALAATLGGALLLARIVLRPVRRMTDDAKRMDADDPQRRIAPASVVAELQTLAETLNAAFDRQQAALDRQRRFTADAGHELRTPVSILKSNADLLLRRERTLPEYVEGLELQRRTTERMRVLVEDLLTLARVDAGGDPLPLTATSVDALLGDVATELGPVAEARGVRLDVDAAPGVFAHCDRAASLRVLRNLVSNALKFAPPGGRVHARAEDDGRCVRIAVGDSGPGIPEEFRERVFERFFRVQEGRDRNEGTGLGLAIVHSLVTAQGGGIEVGESEDGGAELVVTLRRADDPGPAAGRPQRHAARAAVVDPA